jgi:hypothetical protein
MTTLIPKFDLKDGGATPTGAVNRPINQKLQEIISAKDLGVIGDGVTDDTAAIQAAINYAYANKLSLYFPAGIYLISSVITLTTQAFTDSLVIYGAGYDITVFKCNGTAFFQSNQAQNNDYIYLSDFTISKNTSSNTIGLDIGTVRNSFFMNLKVANFLTAISISINQGFGNYWNRFINVEANCGASPAGSKGWVFGNNDVGAAFHDLDYNDFYGCKSFGCETGIYAYNVIACTVSGHQVTACTTALTLLAGNNNRIELNAEAVTNMGSAASETLANKLDLYNDGNLATTFVDNGTNYLTGNLLNLPLLPNNYKTIDSFVQDRIFSSVTAATTPLFSVDMSAREGAMTVTLTTSGYIAGTSESAGIQVWDVIRTGNGTPTITLVRTTGTNLFTVAATSGGVVTWTIAGNASAQSFYNTVVNIQGIGVPQAYPWNKIFSYARLV